MSLGYASSFKLPFVVVVPKSAQLHYPSALACHMIIACVPVITHTCSVLPQEALGFHVSLSSFCGICCVLWKCVLQNSSYLCVVCSMCSALVYCPCCHVVGLTSILCNKDHLHLHPHSPDTFSFKDEKTLKKVLHVCRPHQIICS